MASRIRLLPGDDLALAAITAPAGCVIRLEPGEYRTKLMITSPGVTIEGAGADKTFIIGGDYAKAMHSDGMRMNTFRTYTCAVCADDVTLRRLSIVNDAGNPAEKGQAVALSVLGNRFLMEDCCLSSLQDTLFAGPLPIDLLDRYRGFLSEALLSPAPSRQHYRRCLIEGSVDFIFGCADALFEDCEIRSLDDTRAVGYAAAPAHGPEQTQGFCFSRCRFTCAPGVSAGSVFLARPWRDYGIARFDRCTYAVHIAKAGFDPWRGTHRDKTARFEETPLLPGRVPWVKGG